MLWNWEMCFRSDNIKTSSLKELNSARMGFLMFSRGACRRCLKSTEVQLKYASWFFLQPLLMDCTTKNHQTGALPGFQTDTCFSNLRTIDVWKTGETRPDLFLVNGDGNFGIATWPNGAKHCSTETHRTTELKPNSEISERSLREKNI